MIQTEMETETNCFCCGKELASEVQYNLQPGREMLTNQRERGLDISAEETAALTEGLICDDCVLRLSCPYCGAIGVKLHEFDFGVDSQTGYHDAGVRCTQCAAGPREPELEMVLRRPPASELPELLWDLAVAMNRTAAARARAKGVA